MVTRLLRGYDVMVACQLPKLNARVRFPLPAPACSATVSWKVENHPNLAVLPAVLQLTFVFGSMLRFFEAVAFADSTPKFTANIPFCATRRVAPR